MQVLIAIELIAGAFFVIVFALAQIARDLSSHQYQPSLEDDDDDETTEA
jgi:hypothetical protein